MVEHTTSLNYRIRRMNAEELLDLYNDLTINQLISNIYSSTIQLIKQCYKQITNQELN